MNLATGPEAATQGPSRGEGAVARSMALVFLCCIVQMFAPLLQAEPCQDCGTEFERAYALEGEPVYLHCPRCNALRKENTAAGYSFSWSRNGSSSNMSLLDTARIHVQQNRLGLFPAQTTDSGHYQCVMGNSTSCWKKRVQLIVYNNDKGLCYKRSLLFRQKLKACSGTCSEDNIDCPYLSDFITPELAQVRWYKECALMKMDGSKFKAAGFKLNVGNLTKEDEGNYVCQISYNNSGVLLYISRAVELEVKVPQQIIPPVIIYPKDERLYVSVGSPVLLTCNVSYTRSEWPVVLWMANDDSAENYFGSSNRAVVEELFSSTSPNGSKVITCSIKISEVKVEDYSVKFFCVLQETKRYISLQPPTSYLLAPLIACALALAFIIVIAVVAYKLIKIDIVLCYRKSFFQLMRKEEFDGKLYDACVTFLKDTNSNNIDSVNLFVLKCLPEVLERHCGYKLFIYGRDDLPGEAVADVIAQAVEKSRRLIIVLTRNKLSEDIWRNKLEQHVALYDALINNKSKIILIEMDKIDYMEMSESFRFIKQKHGTIRWKGNFTNKTLSPNTQFWKRVRYCMPPGKHKSSTSEFTTLPSV